MTECMIVLFGWDAGNRRERIRWHCAQDLALCGLKVMV